MTNYIHRLDNKVQAGFFDWNFPLSLTHTPPCLAFVKQETYRSTASERRELGNIYQFKHNRKE